jgi:hypothetical protein
MNDDLKITNIRYGKGYNDTTLYATLYARGEIAICATLEYIVSRLPNIIEGRIKSEKKETC